MQKGSLNNKLYSQHLRLLAPAAQNGLSEP
jgi:hypothetical protein